MDQSARRTTTRTMTFRSRKLLDLAHSCTQCMAGFAHACTGWQGCEPAHSDSQMFGRGHGHKAADWATAFVCHAAHMELDRFDRETKQAEWLRAFVKTQNYLWTNELIAVRKAA